MRDKKGVISARYVYWITIYVLAMMIFIIVLRIGIGSKIVSDNSVQNSAFSLVVNRVVSSQYCGVYFDSQRTYPGVIDVLLFNQNNLDSCFAIKEDNGFGAILDLRKMDSSVVSIVKINSVVADLYYACDVKEKNFKCLTKRQNVVLYEKGKFYDGYLDFFVVVLDE